MGVVGGAHAAKITILTVRFSARGRK